MNFQNMTNGVLVQNTKGFVAEEREVLINLLQCFAEIHRRRLFVEYKFKNLFQMVTKFFGYSEDQANRRIGAMHLMREIPEVETKISNGELQLTNIGVVRTLFEQEAKLGHKLSREEKVEILEEISSKSVRETEKILLSHSSAPLTLKPDQMRSITAEDIELRFISKECTRQKIERLKGMLAHSSPNISLGELFDRLCDLGIEEWQKPHRRCSRKPKSAIRIMEAEESMEADSSITDEVTPTVAAETMKRVRRIDLEKPHEPVSELSMHQERKPKLRKTAAPKKRRVISADMRRLVFAKADHCCENCKSRHALEIDHIRPIALGGTDEPDNLRLLCRSCNQHAAIRAYGQMHMDQYLQ